MGELILFVFAIVVIIAGYYSRKEGRKKAELVAENVIGMTAKDGTTFIKDHGCRYIVVKNNNMTRIVAEREYENVIKLYIQDGKIINSRI